MRKRIVGLLFLVIAVMTTLGCAYGGVATIDGGKAIVMRNDGFLFGALRTVYVCNVSGSGLSDCKEVGETP